MKVLLVEDIDVFKIHNTEFTQQAQEYINKIVHDWLLNFCFPNTYLDCALCVSGR